MTSLDIPSLIPRPGRPIRVSRGCLEPGGIVLGEFFRQGIQVTADSISPRTLNKMERACLHAKSNSAFDFDFVYDCKKMEYTPTGNPS